MACKDIIIDIENFVQGDSYDVMVKRIDNIITDGSIIPSYSKVTTGRQTIFKSLPDGDYSACVQRICATGGRSDSICKDVVGHDCDSPEGIQTTGVTSTAATIEWTDIVGVTYIIYIDDGSKLDPSAAGAHALTGLTPNSVYKAAVKAQCKVSEYSAPAIIYFSTHDGGVEAFTTRIIRKLCTGTTFDGYLMRFAITGGLAGVGDIYKIDFVDFDGNTHVMGEYTVGVGDTLTTMIKKIANDLGGFNLIIGSDYASFDIISREQKAAHGVAITCQEINLTSGYSLSIV